ncbi:hypothetical protein [Solimonas sp. SE-A11]|uniref:hypothetical protein n=1 Tax=Solimonas sp. SE-A11 TaxID=3054954 RepID=UPI00259CBB6F|nr:hypothetical protein [Solimonas sp. SE-A11]MDM4769157.1 hypothetical protein [Solimonas sp. SE-A11]
MKQQNLSDFTRPYVHALTPVETDEDSLHWSDDDHDRAALALICGSLLRLVRRQPGRGEVDAAEVAAIGQLLAQGERFLEQGTVQRCIVMARAWTQPEGWRRYGATSQVVQTVMIAAVSGMIRSLRHSEARRSD